MANSFTAPVDGVTLISASHVSDLQDAIQTGWMPAGETLTYDSSVSVYVSGDVRTKYPVGTKIKFTQTSVKYLDVYGVTYSAPYTYLGLTGGADYTVANAPITAPYLSYCDRPQGFPASFTYTPTAVGLTSPVYGAQTGSFFMVHGWVFARGYLDITSWAGQTGYLRVALPTSYSAYRPGSFSYFRTGGSANDGPGTAIVISSNLGLVTADSSDAASWEASARVILDWSIEYQP